MQKCRISMPWFLGRKMGTYAGHHMNVKTYSSETLRLLPAPHAPGNLTLFSHAGFPARVQNRSRKPGTSSELWAYSRRATQLQHTHLTASAVLPRGTKPPRQYKSSESDASSREPRPLRHPIDAFPSSAEVGGANMLHTTGKVSKSPPAKVCLKTNSVWTIISYIYSKCL